MFDIDFSGRPGPGEDYVDFRIWEEMAGLSEDEDEEEDGEE